MAESKGFITLDRNIRESWLWAEPEYLRAWLSLLYLATYQPAGRKVIRQGQVLTLARGELAESQRDLAELVGLSRQRLRTFLGLLKTSGTISTHQSTHQITVITVLNYDEYQLEPNGQPTDQPNANPPPTHRQPTLYIRNKGNKGKREARPVENSRDNGDGVAAMQEAVRQADADAIKIWRDAVNELAGKLDPHSYNTWLRPTCGLRLDGNELVVGVPNAVFADWLAEHYGDEVRAVIADEVEAVRFEVVP